MPRVQTVEPLQALVLDWEHGRSLSASSAYGPPLHWRSESSQSPLFPYPWAPFSSLGQVVLPWMEELAEGHEEGIWEEGEEVLVGLAFQPPPSQVGSPRAPRGYVGASSECPCLQECWVMK